jgi:hypothetical protein
LPTIVSGGANHAFVVITRRRPSAAKPTRPESNSHAAAGSGTAFTVAVMNWVLSLKLLSK